MDKFKELKINSFRKNNSFFKDEEKKKCFLSLNKNSLFLKRVIEIKERERNSSKKLLGIKSNRFDINNEICKNFETLPEQSLSRIYKNPQYFQTLLKKTKAEYPNRRKANNYSSNINDISNINISNSSNHNRIYLSFHRMHRPNSFLAKYEMNPFFSPNLIYKSNKNNFSKCNTDSRVLNFNGRKMFAPLSLSKINNINSQNLHENKSELYRNYHELKLKKEEIYNRKLKQNLSAENRQILNIKKDKDIKQQTIEHLTINNNLNRNKKLNKIKKIPRGNKKLKHIKKEDILKKIEENKNSNNSFSIVHKIDKKMILTLNNKKDINSSNLTFIKNPKLFTVNQKNIKYIKYIKSTKPNKINFMHNINITDENKENISQNIINGNIMKNKTNTIDDFSKKNKRIIITKNNINGNLIKESIFHSKDNKLTLKIHTLKNRNQIPKLSIEKFNISISNKNNSTNNDENMIKFPKRAKKNIKNKILLEIKE